jgi:hypothetical protein
MARQAVPAERLCAAMPAPRLSIRQVLRTFRFAGLAFSGGRRSRRAQHLDPSLRARKLTADALGGLETRAGSYLGMSRNHSLV